MHGGYGEVIIANGAVRTPQLLMLSGIGPKEHLEQFGVKYYFIFHASLNLFE